jgi:Domain of unknown function (DUF4328)
VQPEGVALDEKEPVRGEPYRPLGRRAQITTILLILGIGTSIAGIVSGLMERSLLADIEQGRFVTQQELDDNDVRQGLVAAADFILVTTTAVFFLLWFYRAYRNLTSLGASHLRWGYGWAIGGWFVPILSLWRPKQIANDIWRASAPRTTDEYLGMSRAGDDSVPKIYLVWWITWLVSSQVYLAAARLSVSAGDVQQLRNANGAFLAADAISIGAAVLAVLVVQRTTGRQEEAARASGLVPDDDRSSLWRRRSSWAAAGAIVAGMALQVGLGVAIWQNDPFTPQEAAQAPTDGAPPGTLLSDDFSQEGSWLVEDDPSLTFDYVSGAYRIYLKKQGLWSSIHALPGSVDSLTLEADASAESVELDEDFYGLSCLTADGASFLFGVSPDGYYTVAFDPGADQQLEFQRLVEDQARRRFSSAHGPNHLRVDCARNGGEMTLRLFVNGKRVAETTHESAGGLAGVEMFAFSQDGGTDIRFDNLVARSNST